MPSSMVASRLRLFIDDGSYDAGASHLVGNSDGLVMSK